VSRRRVIVAFEEVESAASRVVEQLTSPTFADGDLRGPPAGRGGTGARQTSPVDADEHFRLAPVSPVRGHFQGAPAPSPTTPSSATA
jgi:hypothetical protein